MSTHSSPTSSLSSASSTHNQPTTTTTTTTTTQTAEERPGWTHIDDDDEEDDDDDDEDDEEQDRLWEINPSSPTHHPRQRRIPSITLIDPQAALPSTTTTTTTTTTTATTSLLASLSPLTPQQQQPPPPPPPPLIAHQLTTPTEEWRSKILNSVRKGEEKVAQRRKQSLASLDSTPATQQPAPKTETHSADPKGKQPAAHHPDQPKTFATNNPYLDALKPDLSHLQQPHQLSTPSDDSAPPKPPIPPRPLFTDPPPSIQPTSIDPPPSIQLTPTKRPSGSPRSYSHIRSSSNSITELPSRPVVPNSTLSRSNSALGRAQHLGPDQRALASRLLGSSPDSPATEPPPPVDGTFLTVIDPDLSSRLAAANPSSASASPDHSQPGSNFSTSPNPQPDQFGRSASNTRNPSTTRSKTGKRNFFSTLLSRASGSNSNPTSPGPSSFPGSASRNPFESTFNRPSNPDHHSRAPNHRSGLETYGTSNQATDPAHPDRTASPGLNPSYATASTLASMNLKLTPLTPTLPASRNSQPLCGAILDDKFLLIGTNNGLDFVPLTAFAKSSNSSDRSRGSVHTVKPISLIKKTRFKSLKVLEVRSNILLAIAGRNDHLRVYALDGIRAIVAKKIQDLEEKEDFVWLPKTLARVTPHKGKERVSNPQAQPTASNSPQYSPPPPYGGKLGPGQTMAKSSSCQPASPANHQASPVSRSPGKSALRRSSTVGSRLPSASAAYELLDTRRSSLYSASDASSFISPLGLVAPTTLTSALQSLRAENSDRLPPNHPALGQAPVQVGLEQAATEESGNGSSQPGPPPIINIDDDLAQRSNITGANHVGPVGKPDQGTRAIPGQGGPAGPALVEVIRKRSQLLAQAGKRVNPNSPIQPISSSRLVPRSALATDTDNESMDGSHLNLVDVLSQPAPKASTALGISTSAPGREPRRSTGEAPSVVKKSSVPPSITTPNEAARPQINVTDEITELDPQSNAASTSLPRPGLITPMSDDVHRVSSSHSSPSPLPTPSRAAPSRVPSGVHSDQENQPSSLTVPSRSKKRWSVMDSVFRTHSNSNNNNNNSGSSSNSDSHHNSPSNAGSSGLLPARSSTDDSLARSASCNQFSPSPFPEAQNATLRSRPSTQKLRANVSESNGEFGGMAGSSTGPATTLNGASGPNPPGGPAMAGSRAAFEDQPRERGSKNISLSLNRTFVLPETPRTIEFQMQGDDLVDIYLVYDESVFALEPATVRVREVGIGRNERRAARRERERAARDLASINMRPAVTATGADGAAAANPGRGYMTDPATESLIEAVGAPARTTVSASPSTVDDGLTLSAPVPSSSFRQASVAHTSNIAGGWGSHENPGGGSSGGHPGAAKVPNLWPYTTFQQLQFIPPLPPSVLASTFVIPPTYEAVVTASGGPKAVQGSLAPPDEDPARTLSPINVVEPESEDLTIPLNLAVDRLSISNGSSSILGEAGGSEAGSSAGVSGGSAKIHAGGDGSEGDMELSDVGDTTVTIETSGRQAHQAAANPTPQTILADGPLLSPISLLSNPASRQIGPPGLFLVTRGKKVTSIVDCDGRSVMKKPFIWMNDKHAKPSGPPPETGGGQQQAFRIEVVLIDERRTVLVGLDQQEVKLFEVGGRQAKGLEDFSNAATLDILPHLILADPSSSGATAVGGGNGVGVITAQSFPASLGFRDHHHHHHSALNLGSLANLSIGLGKPSPTPSHGASTSYPGALPASSIPSSTGGLPSTSSAASSSSAATAAAAATPAGGTTVGPPVAPGDREVVFLAASVSRNAVVWAERIGSSFAIYTLDSALPVLHHHPPAPPNPAPAFSAASLTHGIALPHPAPGPAASSAA
ncbi:hypothetical protein PTTG_26314 [Puccinia triticina 1-1 BBBD Race 1]|uniref:CNH domain-containing protein n=1 Tax=Puccinia triticina (isolate 1-1 / race 1 (BBBD)) TaxID=630390 RepID=A0A180GUM5_PUCT1|nr:hypothetical protein PTTG_26314 [Puccinia triticina 1-1 BBBD Race 1]